MDEVGYNKEMDLIYRMIGDGKYALVVKSMMLEEGFGLKGVYRFDANHSWYVLGSIFLKSGDHALAIKAFKRSLKSWPGDVDALMAVGNVYGEMGRCKMAERFFRKGLLIKPENSGLRFNLANALFDQGKLDLARKEYELIAKKGEGLSDKAKKMMSVITQKIGKGAHHRP